MTNVALQRSDVKLAEFIAEMMQFNTDMFVFVDEMGSLRFFCHLMEIIQGQLW